MLRRWETANCQALVSLTLAVWLVAEHRMSGERKYYLANLRAKTPAT
jgi:hypothetical protein